MPEETAPPPQRIAPPQATDRVVPRPGILLARGLLYLILLLILSGTLWAWISRVDVVVSAEGRLVPRGEPIRLSPAEAGVVREILVAVGDRVEAGQPLLRLDGFRQDAEALRLRHEIEGRRAEAARAREAAAAVRGVIASNREELARHRNIHRIVTDQHRTFRDLAAEGVFSRIEAQSKEREVAEVEASVLRLEAEIRRAEEEEGRNLRLAEEAEAGIRALEADLGRAAETIRRTVLVSPAAGTVSHLAATRTGRYLAADEVAAVILPRDEPLAAMIEIPNESMRRLREGLPARLKFEAFPFQDYGTVEGRLLQIDPDATDGGKYKAWIGLDRFSVFGPHGEENLRAGLSFHAEIIVDRRRLVEIALDPFRRLRGGWSISE